MAHCVYKESKHFIAKRNHESLIDQPVHASPASKPLEILVAARTEQPSPPASRFNPVYKSINWNEAIRFGPFTWALLRALCDLGCIDFVCIGWQAWRGRACNVGLCCLMRQSCLLAGTQQYLRVLIEPSQAEAQCSSYFSGLNLTV